MKIIFALIGLLFSFSTLAISIEEAQTLYNQRGENINNARQAAEIFSQLASSEREVFLRAELLTLFAQAIYYYGDQLPEAQKEEKLAIFERGYSAAESAANLLALSPGVPGKIEYKTALARAYYFFCSNLGKWGEVKGVLNSLGKWPTLKEHLNYILNLDETVLDYGANRILGRAYMKIPYESNKKGLELLRTAYEKTLVKVGDVTLSRNSTTIIFFLESLRKENEKKTFCSVYSSFSSLSENESLWSEYNAERLPETKNDIQEFLENEFLAEYFNDN